MKINHLFLVFGIVICAVLSAMAVVTFKTGHTELFIASEGLIIFIIACLIFFHRRYIKPLQIIGDGMDLLQEQDFNSRLKKIGQPEADRIILLFNKMMEALKEERLHVREQNQFLDLLINASPLGVLILDFDAKIWSANKASLDFMALRQEDATGKKLSELEDIPLIKSMLQIERDTSQIIRLSDANVYKCTHSRFIDHGFHRSFYLVELLTEEVFKAEKKAYGQVIRMIAHEVNNTTAGGISTLDAVLESFQDDEIHNLLNIIIERCYGMNRFITSYAEIVRIPEAQRAPHNINLLLASCMRFMEKACHDKGIEVILKLTEEQPVANIDIAMFEQVIVNIIKNSIEAFDGGGKIVITTTASPVTIEIADTGKGIDNETESKLFTPFFSTKPDGQGLGLIFIREVLQKHHCTFSLKTCPDGLTRFMIKF